MMDIFPALVCPARWGKLMVCTDASDEGQNAVALTLELARACDSQVFAVQVLQVVPEFQAVAPDLRATLERGIQENMAVIKAAADQLGVSLKPVMPEGQLPHAAIVAAAEKIRPDLIIMGRCGKSALARILMGNVTARVIGHSPVNVLVAPQGVPLNFQRLLIASDGSPFSEAAWTEALTLAKTMGSALIGVSVAAADRDIPAATEVVRGLEAAASQQGIALDTMIPVGRPEEGIVKAAEFKQASLIILGSHGRTGLKRLLMGSVAERVIGNAKCPVLVVKKK